MMQTPLRLLFGFNPRIRPQGLWSDLRFVEFVQRCGEQVNCIVHQRSLSLHQRKSKLRKGKVFVTLSISKNYLAYLDSVLHCTQRIWIRSRYTVTSPPRNPHSPASISWYVHTQNNIKISLHYFSLNSCHLGDRGKGVGLSCDLHMKRHLIVREKVSRKVCNTLIDKIYIFLKLHIGEDQHRLIFQCFALTKCRISFKRL